MVGDGARALCARAFAVEEGDPLLDAAVASFNASYVAHPCVHTTLLRGARELLEHAAASGVPNALVTNKPREVTLLLLEKLGVAEFFQGIWAGGDGPLKPSPAGLLAMAKHLDIDVRKAWMIGDGPQDVGAGKSAGCVTIGVPGIGEHERLVASGPSILCESLVDVRGLFGSLG
jgi:phosphoglycolate phosphatase